jgi:hypothetical protein
MFRKSKTKDLDIERLKDFYSKYAIITSVNYISKSKTKNSFILEKYSLYNSRQIKYYANIMLRLKIRKHTIIISIYIID